jgi:ribonuclease VapC
LSRAVVRGADPDRIASELTEAGLLHGAVTIEPFTADDAAAVARLRSATREAGLASGERACLALAQRLKATVLTADKAWSSVEAGVEVVVFR